MADKTEPTALERQMAEEKHWPDDELSFRLRFPERHGPWFDRLVQRVVEGRDCRDGMLGDAMVDGDQARLWGRLTNLFYDHSFLHPGSRFGWVDPSGDFLGCDHAGHERLLDLLGLDIVPYERKAIRVGMARVSLEWLEEPPTDAQWTTLARLIDTHQMMPGAVENLRRKIKEMET